MSLIAAFHHSDDADRGGRMTTDNTGVVGKLWSQLGASKWVVDCGVYYRATIPYPEDMHTSQYLTCF